MKEWITIVVVAASVGLPARKPTVPLPDRNPAATCPANAKSIMKKIDMRSWRWANSVLVGEYHPVVIGKHKFELGGMAFGRNSRGNFCDAVEITPHQMRRIKQVYPLLQIVI